MFMQFKTIEKTDIMQIETMRESDLRAQLATLKTDYEELTKKQEETVTKVNEYIQKIETNQEASELLKKELEQLDLMLGKSDVKGSGVIITLKNTKEADVSDTMLLELLNDLRNGGAEAISINDHRIINMTDISSPTGNSILINTNDPVRLTSPFVVKAIGNQTTLESNLNQTDGFIPKYGKSISITLERPKSVKILKYNGEIKLEYMKDKS